MLNESRGPPVWHLPSLLPQGTALPVPGLESVTGSLEEVALHDNAVHCINVVLQLHLVTGEVLAQREASCQPLLLQKLLPSQRSQGGRWDKSCSWGPPRLSQGSLQQPEGRAEKTPGQGQGQVPGSLWLTAGGPPPREEDVA